MKIIIRTLNDKASLLKIEENELWIGPRHNKLPSAPGIYLVMPTILNGAMVGHGENTALNFLTLQTFYSSPEVESGLRNRGIFQFWGTYVNLVEGEETLLINTPVFMEEGCEFITPSEEEATLRNLDLLKLYVPYVPSNDWITARQRIMRYASASKSISSLENQVDMLTKVVESLVKKESAPEWQDEFFTMMDKTTSLTNEVSELIKENYEFKMKLRVLVEEYRQVKKRDGTI